MKKITFLIGALLMIGLASAQNWSLDKAHSKLGFGVTHMLISEVEGNFNSFDAKIVSKSDDFSDAVIELTADVASINTNNEGRDKHLKSPDFFDAEKFNSLSFKSKSLTKVEGKKYKLVGDLTLHGVTKEVTLDVVFNGSTIHPFNKKTIAGFKVTGIFKRSDFGVGTPSSVVSDEVELRANTEFVKS
ncbi:MAG: YceI family protein [Bacteroidetes bacterium]|nr:YceI family protein [Bacteroidota bacterium]